MIGLHVTSVLLALASQCIGIVIPSTNRVFEELERPPRDWAFYSEAEPREYLPLE